MAYTCRGFRFAGVHAGIKKEDTPDLGLLAVTSPSPTAAAIFTRNRVVAAPVTVSRRALKQTGGRARVAVVNSGNANACTGEKGLEHALQMAKAAAETVGAEPNEVIVSSTGVIGAPLPIRKVLGGINAAGEALRAGGFDDFSRAILTTDRGPKTARRRLEVSGARATLLGCTKGAGMIAPNMATTLSFVCTDAAIASEELSAALVEASESTFNAITVDGDTSTNDMILVVASGGAKNHRVGARALGRFTDALTDLLAELSRKLMREGEGVHHVVEIKVRGAKSEKNARAVAQTIANSPLVKTAIAGCDPNWGRILAAAGRAGVAFDPSALSLWIGDVEIASNGESAASREVERQAKKVMRQPEYEITLAVGDGDASASFLACDLSHDYVTINADYRT